MTTCRYHQLPVFFQTYFRITVFLTKHLKRPLNDCCAGPCFSNNLKQMPNNEIGTNLLLLFILKALKNFYQEANMFRQL
jgi:hypothetical protein